MNEIKQEQLLTVRSMLGEWQCPSFGFTERCIVKNRDVTPQEDLRIYSVEHFRTRNGIPLNYNLTHGDTVDLLTKLTQKGFKCVVPLYPELKAYFRDGKLLTLMDDVSDAMDTIEITTKPMSGLEALMNLYK